MTIYTPPTRDMEFILHEVLKVTESGVPGFDELDRDITGPILEECGKFAAEVFHPLNQVGDQQGCHLKDGIVHIPEGFHDAFDQLREAGWTTLDCDEAYGGQGMPHVMGIATGEFFASANMALGMYHGLTHGAYSAIRAHGTEEQKQKWLPKMVTCEWTGTMNLTEPHAGTDLGLMRTKAEPQADGSYKITGTKIFISAGDHEMADNIVHLVLARIPGGPDGVKGISLFIVPKKLVDDEGNIGAANGVSVGALEKKMGIHGNSTCVMNFDGSTGYLLGEEHKGLRAMFTMMNEARLGVALQGYAQASIAYQNAVAYANDRLQGRAVTGTKNPDGPADPIIVHPDVRRNLMDQKSFVEGARMLTFWAAELIDRDVRMDDKDAHGIVSLLIPVIKGVQTDKGFQCAVQAQQTFGGHGFIEEHGMSQFVRDARITMIYEGANGVQSLDLVGRKLPHKGGKALVDFFNLVKGFIKENEGNEALNADFLTPLKAASKDLQSAAAFFMREGIASPDNALAGSYDFMHMFGHVAIGLMWARMAKASMEALEAGAPDAAFYETKLATGRYYMGRQLPETATQLARIETGGAPVMALDAEAF